MSRDTEMTLAFERVSVNVQKLVTNLSRLSTENKALKEELVSCHRDKVNLQTKLEDLQESYQSLEYVSAMIGDSEGKTEIKQKIDSLVMEVDACIDGLVTIQT